MRAEIVSVGTEILLGQIVDTNAAELGRLFASTGVDHVFRQTVGDNLQRLVEALRLALSRSDIVVTIGGLGPTEDDITRDGVAAALDSPLVLDPALEAGLRELFERRGLVWTSSQTRQAHRPECARPIENPNGTAPGLLAMAHGKTVICLPGPRNEFVPMVKGPVAAALADLSGGGAIVSRVLRVVGIGEAALEERIQDLLDLPDVTVAPYAKVGEVHLRLTTRVAAGGQASALDPVAAAIRARLGTMVYGEDDQSLEAVVLDLMRRRGLTLVTAESLTGGMVGARFTSVDGASKVYRGGFVTYADDEKADRLGVPRLLLESPDHGAVSEAVALAMAEGAVRQTGADVAVSTTGVAGSEPLVENGVEKPSGLVYVAVAGLGPSVAVRHQHRGDRATVRARATQHAVHLLYQSLVNSGD
ncbi:MAG: competence/damage-inducible protein A [Fimbriimonadaceae bacterium]|nr:competence/damage-inducible protein A [Fimbriimonadaceae bacterium]